MTNEDQSCNSPACTCTDCKCGDNCNCRDCG